MAVRTSSARSRSVTITPQDPKRGEVSKMRYALAILALVVSVAAAASAALAQTVDQSGNVVQLQYPGGNGGGAVYVDGVARSSVQPAAVTLYPASDLGTVAGGGVHDVSVDVSRDQEGNQ